MDGMRYCAHLSAEERKRVHARIATLFVCVCVCIASSHSRYTVPKSVPLKRFVSSASFLHHFYLAQGIAEFVNWIKCQKICKKKRRNLFLAEVWDASSIPHILVAVHYTGRWIPESRDAMQSMCDCHHIQAKTKTAHFCHFFWLKCLHKQPETINSFFFLSLCSLHVWCLFVAIPHQCRRRQRSVCALCDLWTIELARHSPFISVHFQLDFDSVYDYLFINWCERGFLYYSIFFFLSFPICNFP